MLESLGHAGRQAQVGVACGRASHGSDFCSRRKPRSLQNNARSRSPVGFTLLRGR